MAREAPLARCTIGTLAKIAAGEKISKERADYVDHPVDGERCDGCSMYVSLAECSLVRGYIAPDGHCRFWEQKKVPTIEEWSQVSVVKSSDHPGGIDLHVKPENAEPISGIPVADVVTRANVQHVSWEMVREGKFDPRPARLPLADLIATQQVVDRQRVLKHMRELAEGGEVETKAPPLVLLWDGDYFLLGGHHGCQAAYNLGVREIGVMLMEAPE